MMATQSGTLRRARWESIPWPVQLGTRLLLANLLLVLSAKMAVPLPWTPVPLTLQTFGVMLISILFGARTSAVATGLYLIEGAAGLPVFQPFGVTGAARLFGPTAGYLLAFPVAAFLTGSLIEKLLAPAAPTGDARKPWVGWLRSLAALLPGQMVILLSGWAWLATLAGPKTAFAQGVAPFLGGECVKIATAAAVAATTSRRN